MIDGMASLYRDQLQAALDDRIEELQAAVSSGACKSLEDYKDKCGYIRALRDMTGLMQEVAQGLVERN